MNTLLRIQGYVTDAHVLEPYAKHSYDIKRYELHLCPSDYTHFYDLEHRVEELKREYEKQQPYESQRYANHDKRPVLKDRVFVGTSLKFESLHSPRLEGDFSFLTRDDIYRCFSSGCWTLTVSSIRKLFLVFSYP